MVKTLIAAKANLLTENHRGQMALDIAKSRYKIKTVALLETAMNKARSKTFLTRTAAYQTNSSLFNATQKDRFEPQLLPMLLSDAGTSSRPAR